MIRFAPSSQPVAPEPVKVSRAPAMATESVDLPPALRAEPTAPGRAKTVKPRAAKRKAGKTLEGVLQLDLEA